MNRNGSAPNTGTSSQIKATTRKLSRGPTAAPVFGPVIWSSSRPAPAATAPAARNGHVGVAVAERDGGGDDERGADPLQDAADQVERTADVDAGDQSTFSTSAGAARDSTKMITWSPASSESEPCGKITLPSRIRRRSPIRSAAGRRTSCREFGLRADRQVEDLEAVALEHGDLADARVVGEAHELLRDHLARVDRDDASAL